MKLFAKNEKKKISVMEYSELKDKKEKENLDSFNESMELIRKNHSNNDKKFVAQMVAYGKMDMSKDAFPVKSKDEKSKETVATTVISEKPAEKAKVVDTVKTEATPASK